MKARRAAIAGRLAGAVLVVLAFASCALLPTAARAFGRNKVQTKDLQWKVLTTPHFEIHHYDGSEELAVRASIIAERAYREYADRLEHELQTRVPFILYASHGDFAQTNISDSLIGEGTGGFSEPLRNRMVLPYNGSHEQFVHVIRHELVHMFMFDSAYGSLKKTPSYMPFFNIPLWFAEGTAEWFSSGWDAEADMYIRDATLHDYLWPLEQTGGFMVYKQGQAAMRMISEVYGDRKLVDLWRLVGRTRNMRRALDSALGLDMEEFDRRYASWLRSRYWAAYGSLEEPADVARRLTDHVDQMIGYSQRGVLSPDGETVAYFSDKEGLPAIFLMSALDGKQLRRLARGARADRFESLHGFQSSLSFSPDGSEVAFIARSGNHETLHTMDVRRGELTRSLKLGLDVARFPAWSPAGSRIALAGTRNGRTDLYLVDLDGRDDGAARVGEPQMLPGGAAMLRLTDDVGDESDPAWSPDGSRLAFVRDARAEVDFEFEIDPEGRRRLLWARFREDPRRDGIGSAPRELVILDVSGGGRTALKPPEGEWREPVWTGAASLCVVETRSGIANLARVDLDSTASRVAGVRSLTNVVGGLSRPSYAPGADRLIFTAFQQGGWDLFAVDGYAEWSRRRPGGEQPDPVVVSAPSPPERSLPPGRIDDPEDVGQVEPYGARFSVDASRALGGGAVYFSSSVGLGMANVITLSDLLGDRRLSFLVNFYGSIDNSDLAASYFMLKHRIDYGFGAFHYKNYYNSAFTSVGELLADDAYFSERNYGVFGIASYPFSTFRRLDFELQALTSERTLYEPDPTNTFLVEGEKSSHRLLRPSLSYVQDSSYYGSFGPVVGSRLTVSFAPAISVGGSTLDRRTAAVDWRRYWLPWRRNTFAARLTGAWSEGADPRYFVLGGPFTLRGYDFYDYESEDNLAGPRMAMLNLEYRLPLFDALIFGWPGRWGIGPIGGTLFFDLGAAWEGDLQPWGRDRNGDWGLRDLRGDYGFGIRTRIGFLPLKFDWARRTDLRRVGGTVFHFSIGPEF